MPYSMIKVKGGYQVTSPNHPEGHSGKPMTHKNAIAQMLIMQRAEAGPAPGPNKFENQEKLRRRGPGE